MSDRPVSFGVLLAVPPLVLQPVVQTLLLFYCVVRGWAAKHFMQQR